MVAQIKMNTLRENPNQKGKKFATPPMMKIKVKL